MISIAPGSPVGVSAEGKVDAVPVFGSDLAPRRGALEVRVVRAPFSRARIAGCDAGAARAIPGVLVVLTAADLPAGRILTGDWPGLPVLAENEILHFGQAVALVAALTPEAAERAIESLAVVYQPLPPVLGLEEAVALHSFHGDTVTVARGDTVAAMEAAAHTFAHTFDLGEQARELPEPCWAHAEPDDRGGLRLTTPCPPSASLLAALSSVLGLPMSALHVAVPAHSACPAGDPLPTLHAALVAQASGRPAWIRVAAGEQRLLAPRCPGMRAVLDAGIDERGGIVAIDMTVFIDSGCVPVGGEAVLAGVLHHLEGAYRLPVARLAARLCRSHLPPSTGEIGELAARAQLVIEGVVARIAHVLDILPEVVRQRNFPLPAAETEAEGSGAASLGGVPLRADAHVALWKHALRESGFASRRKELDDWNARSPLVKRGLAAVPSKLALGDGRTGPRHASAFLEVCPDGSVRVLSDAETPVQREAVVAAVVAGIGARPGSIRLAPSSGGRGCPELAAGAAADAGRQLRERLLPLIMRIYRENGATDVLAENLRFSAGRIADGIDSNLGFSFEGLVAFATAKGVGLTAAGTCGTPSAGLPFGGFLAGTAVAEVEVDSFTGELLLRRVDLFHESTHPVADARSAAARWRSAFMEGVGWLTTEIPPASAEGHFLGSPPAFAPLVPGLDEDPLDFRVEIVPAAEGGGTCAVGGQALALGVREALRDAIAAFGGGAGAPFVDLPVPASREAIFRLIQQQRSAVAAPPM